MVRLLRLLTLVHVWTISKCSNAESNSGVFAVEKTVFENAVRFVFVAGLEGVSIILLLKLYQTLRNEYIQIVPLRTLDLFDVVGVVTGGVILSGGSYSFERCW